MRGEDLVHYTTGVTSHGITPACAGKTELSSWKRDRLMDHPRMRGEDRLRRNWGSYTWGSPPHARGRLSGSCPTLPVTGITPACAGKTRRTIFPVNTEPDHPRMRGEDIISRTVTLSV